METFLKIITYFLCFLIYSTCGWIIETVIYMIRRKEVVKRGFLFGPLCPIYGAGALLCTLLFYGRIQNIFLLFLIGMSVCTVLEYGTHFVLEKLFHATWWDYSEKRFNIKGRICLQNSLLFGFGAVLTVRILQPWLIALTESIPPAGILWIGILLYSVLLIDLATTVAGLKGTAQRLKSAQTVLCERLQKRLDQTAAYWSKAAGRVRYNERFPNWKCPF